MYGLGNFQTADFMLSPKVYKFVHEPSKSKICIPYSPMVLLNLSLIGFQSQTFRELLSLVQIPRAEVPDVGHKLLTPQGENPYFEIPPSCGSPYHTWGFW